MTRVPAPLVTFAAIVLAAAIAAVPSTAAAQGEKDEAFKAGIEARKDKQWPTVVTEMRRAIQQDSKESTRKVGGIFRATDYLPHYFLGEAYFRQNDCVNAVVAWETSIRQGVVRTRPEYFSELQKGNATCEGKGILLTEKFEAAVSRARAQLESANAAMIRVKDKGSVNIAVWRSQPAFDAQYQRVSSEYDLARKHFGDAQRSRLEKDFNEVVKVTDHVKEIVGSLENELTAAMERVSGTALAADEVKRSIKEAEKIDAEIEAKSTFLGPSLIASRADGQKALENARQQLDPRRLSESTVAAARSSVAEGAGLLQKVLEGVQAAYAKANKAKLDQSAVLATAAFSRADAEVQTVQTLIERNPAKATPEIRNGFETARKQLDSARRRHDAAMRSQLVGGVDAAAKQADDIHARLIALEEGIGVELTLEDRGVPTWLQEGAARYFAGDYAGALDKLDDGRASDAAQLHVHLFRAAAQHALFVRSGEKNTARRDQAVADIRRCKELQPTFAPDTRAFSPAFLEFYQRDGVAPQSAARAQ
ncbi:hypothetical protein LuPra_01321 [Luteitalea pratensis]|uniref:Uncharacterized protein n=1 Tax=Luteitalea pratensis TaxID=1855912 RepID=A0A143PIQ2_LUTPR|nr:hypothetical protein [Luteitalea pratensis]AMY08133.1 hypothetical protein LuPra_01321 [Luteitalea pratensis]